VAKVFARLRLGAFGLATALALVAAAPAQAAKPPAKPVCGPVLPGFMHCDSEAVKWRVPMAHAAALGDIPYGPADIQDAYGLTSIASQYGADQTVAIIDAYDMPTAESDLATYRSAYGLPACTTANGCFKKVNQLGTSSSFPPHDTGWGEEISLDLQAVSAACPLCHILLVEANSTYTTDLGAAVNTAALLGATQISNSYGGPEAAHETTYESYYNHPGVTVTVSSGDEGYGVEYPAASKYVTAVGGTSLYKSSAPRGWTELAWDGAGSGCSAFIAKPPWQHDSNCLTRSVADVSADADPNTGLAVYDSDDHGWIQVGGTSLAAPLVAAAYALTGSAAAAGGYAYDNTSRFNDVTSGSNGSCTFAYLCTALVGYDGPTGVGSPDGAFPTGPPPAGGSGSGSGSGTGSGSGPGAGAPPPPSQPAVPIATAARSAVLVSSASVSASRGGTVKVRVTCGGGPSCSGVLTLQIKLRGAALRTLGKGRFSLAPHKSTVVSVRLSRPNLTLLRQKHRLYVFGTALDSDGTTAQSGFRLSAPKMRKQRRAHHKRHR
jgi:hypothetical protein